MLKLVMYTLRTDLGQNPLGKLCSKALKTVTV